MNVFINGEIHAVAQAATVAELVRELNLPVQSLLVEHNGTALRRSEWEQTPLQESDKLEIIRIVAGG